MIEFRLLVMLPQAPLSTCREERGKMGQAIIWAIFMWSVLAELMSSVEHFQLKIVLFG